MKVLVFIDYHNQQHLLPQLEKKVQQADIIISGGDHSIFEFDQEEILSTFNSWNKPVYIIHGNHEYEDDLRELCSYYPNLHFVHGEKIIFDKVTFLFWGGGGFSKHDLEFHEQQKEWFKKPIIGTFVLITHAPPFNTKLDNIGRHVGNQTIRDFIDAHKPVFAISGHLHETAGVKDVVGQTKLFNAGPTGILLEF